MVKKPTMPYGYLSFSKEGKITKKEFKISNDKATQEREVAEQFVQSFNEKYSTKKITKLEQLPENDHDFLILVNGKETLLQITELVEREYAVPLTEDEYKHGGWSMYLVNESDAIPWGVDEEKLHNSLTKTIKKKIDKHYSKDSGKDLWLLIFTTTQFITTEFIENCETRESNALKRAIEFLKGEEGLVFDEIWFSNLLKNCLRIWPK